jgi:hypothetical protein
VNNNDRQIDQEKAVSGKIEFPQDPAGQTPYSHRDRYNPQRPEEYAPAVIGAEMIQFVLGEHFGNPNSAPSEIAPSAVVAAAHTSDQWKNKKKADYAIGQEKYSEIGPKFDRKIDSN